MSIQCQDFLQKSEKKIQNSDYCTQGKSDKHIGDIMNASDHSAKGKEDRRCKQSDRQSEGNRSKGCGNYGCGKNMSARKGSSLLSRLQYLLQMLFIIRSITIDNVSDQRHTKKRDRGDEQRRKRSVRSTDKKRDQQKQVGQGHTDNDHFIGDPHNCR